jgi:hypothetical protein
VAVVGRWARRGPVAALGPWWSRCVRSSRSAMRDAPQGAQTSRGMWGFALVDLLQLRPSVDAFFRQRRPNIISPAPGMLHPTGNRSHWPDRVPGPPGRRLARRHIRNQPATRARRADRDPFAADRRRAPVRSRRADRDGRAGRSRPDRAAIEDVSRSDRHRCGWRLHSVAAETRRNSAARSRNTSCSVGHVVRSGRDRSLRPRAPQLHSPHDRSARCCRHRGRSRPHTARQIRTMTEDG